MRAAELPQFNSVKFVLSSCFVQDKSVRYIVHDIFI